MTDATHPSAPPALWTPKPDEAPPALTTGAVGWLRANLFSNWWSTLLTIVLAYVLYKLLWAAADWAIVRAAFGGTDPKTCTTGAACWPVLNEKGRFILFGRFPYQEHWRPLVALLVMIGMILCACSRRFWNIKIIPVLAVGVTVTGILMWGGVFGLTHVETALWGGLPLTLILSSVGIVFAFPLGILLALGRRSDMPAIRSLCVGFIELVRGVPLISVLFMASVMFPLFLPAGVTVDKLLRAQVGIILFASAYLAEVVRGGLQALPKGQYEAAQSLGLSYWQQMGLIILPQALRLVIPPIVNNFIGTFKDTSLVVIIGLFDLLNTAKNAINDPTWRAFYAEVYVFAAVIYFVFCFFMSRYSQRLEVELQRTHKR
jgi:general L-amino acid transport system permease protein